MIWDQLCSKSDEVQDRYQGGETLTSIAASFGCCYAYVIKLLKFYHAHNRLEVIRIKASILEPHKFEIIHRYSQGESSLRLAAHFNCADTTITKFLQSYGVRTRSIRDYAHSVNEHFFDKISTEASAYILGFSMADGCNQPQTPTFSIFITDKEILEEMARAMQYEGPISVKLPQKHNHKIQYGFCIGSRVMCDALEKVGCVRNKSYHAGFPDSSIIPDHLVRHCLRGWGDGDGSIFCSKHRKNLHYTTRIAGTEMACRGISNAVNRILGFPGLVNPINQHLGSEHTIWAFSISRHADLKTYLDWIYQDATIYLGRKHAKYLEFLASYVPKTPVSI